MGDLYRICPEKVLREGQKRPICLGCIGRPCRLMMSIGLDESGEALPKELLPSCGAKTRSGSLCELPVHPGKSKCRLHGGASTGPKTAEGRQRIAEAQRKRWASTSSASEVRWAAYLAWLETV